MPGAKSWRPAVDSKGDPKELLETLRRMAGKVLLGPTSSPTAQLLSFERIADGETLVRSGNLVIGAVGVPAAPHALVSASHTVSGLTPGHFLKALTATTFGFAAHGLTYSDVGAAASSHAHAWADITSGVPTTIGGYGITDFNSLGDARWSLLGHTHAAADLTGTTLAAGVVTSSLTAVGALASGSIASGFGAINIGANALTCGAITATGGIDVDATAGCGIVGRIQDAAWDGYGVGGRDGTGRGWALVAAGAALYLGTQDGSSPDTMAPALTITMATKAVTLAAGLSGTTGTFTGLLTRTHVPSTGTADLISATLDALPSKFAVWTDDNNSINLDVIRSNGAVIFRLMGHPNTALFGGSVTLGTVVGTGTGALYCGALTATTISGTTGTFSGDVEIVHASGNDVRLRLNQTGITSWYAQNMATSGVFELTTSPGANHQFSLTTAGALALAAGLTATTVTASGLISANLGLTVASGQTLTLTGATVTGLTAASVAAGTFPAGAFVFAGDLSGITTLAMTGALSGATTATFSSTVAIGGGAIGAHVGLWLRGTGVVAAGGTAYGILSAVTFGSTATSTVYGIAVQTTTAAASFTLANAVALGVFTPSIGAGSTITNNYGLYVAAISGGATINRAIHTAGGDHYLGGAVQIAGALTTNGGLQTFGANDTGGAGYRLVRVPNV